MTTLLVTLCHDYRGAKMQAMGSEGPDTAIMLYDVFGEFGYPHVKEVRVHSGPMKGRVIYRK